MDPGGGGGGGGGIRNQEQAEEHGFWQQQHVMTHSSMTQGAEEEEGEGAPCWLVDVLLSGGAPWGFTLRGGREHREPLTITKVEQGSRAAAVSLQAGDELVNINEIPLSGSRQEAICLVKGSHKTLSLVVKRHVNMVDIVAQKMPSESDVHVARSFLTKILRSSMRRSEPISRPHSWHATKFNESQSETTKTQTQSPPAQVWHTRYDASSSSSTDLSSGWEQTNLRRVSDQFSSLGSMDSLEHGGGGGVSPHHPYLSPSSPATKSHSSSQEHLDHPGGGGGGGGGGKRDSAYSSFSTSSGTPDYTLSRNNLASSTENVPYKVSQWDSSSSTTGQGGGGGGARHSGTRHSQSLTEGAMRPPDPLDRPPGYLHVTGGGGGRDSPSLLQRADSPQQSAVGSRGGSVMRASCGPVWHVPERKKAVNAPSSSTSSPSPPPPPPPVRSDSFAATKVVQERGLAIAYPESCPAPGETTHVYPKSHAEKASTENKRTEPPASENIGKRVATAAAEGRRSHHVTAAPPPPKSSDTTATTTTTTDQFYFPPDNYNNHNQLGSNRQYSLSSSDVRLGPPSGSSSQPYSHYSDNKSTFYAHAKSVSTAAAVANKPSNNVSGYYSSMQELPTAAISSSSSGQLYGHNHHNNQGLRNVSNPPSSTTSLPTAAINLNPDSAAAAAAAHRYYCVTARQPGGHPLLLGKTPTTEDKKGAAAGTELTNNNNNDPQTLSKQAKHQQQQQHVVSIKNTLNGYSVKQEDSLSTAYKQPVAVAPLAAAPPESSLAKPASDDRGGGGGGGQRRISSQTAVETPLPYASKPSEQRRSLPATLLQQQQQQQRELPPELRLRPKLEKQQQQELICPRATPMLHSLSAESCGEKQLKRVDRFATTLRNEIQMRRAKLQKSVSAATLTGDHEDEDDDVWRNAGGHAPTASYKDHLKEAQARVLKATSFRRRDLEPVLLEHPPSSSSSSSSSAESYGSAALRKEVGGSLTFVSEALVAAAAGGKAGPPPPVTRIGSRKRFPAEKKKARSFSEPDKIHEVGRTAEEEEEGEGEANAGSVGEQRKSYDGAGKPSFPKPPPPTMMMMMQQQRYEDPKEPANGGTVPGSTGQSEGQAAPRGVQSCQAAVYVDEDQSVSLGGGEQTPPSLLEQQRLGTFAEYEARWSGQKRALHGAETSRASGGRYHSADNILDHQHPGPAGQEVATPGGFHHERSRSSPSADFYRLNKVPVPGRKSAEYSQQQESEADQQCGSDARSSDRQGEAPPPLPAAAQRFPPPPPPMTGPPEPPSSSTTTPVYHRPPSVSHSPSTQDPSVPSHPSETPAHHPPPPGLVLGGKKKAPVPLPKPGDSSKRPELTSAPRGPPTNNAAGIINIAPRSSDPAPPAATPRSPVNGDFVGSSPGPPDRAASTNPQPVPASSPLPPSRSSSSSSSSSSHHGPPALPHPPPPPAPASMDGHGRPPSMDGHGRPPSMDGHGRPPSMDGHGRPPSMDGHGRPPSMDGHGRPPSPQFSPQRLSDKPPPSLQDERQGTRIMDSVMDSDHSGGNAVKKVPIKIVHSESLSEKESRQYLLLHDDRNTGGLLPLLPLHPAMQCQPGGPPPVGTPRPPPVGTPRLGGSAEQQDYSVFCAYTRQRETPPASSSDSDPLPGPPESREDPPPPPPAPPCSSPSDANKGDHANNGCLEATQTLSQEEAKEALTQEEQKESLSQQGALSQEEVLSQEEAKRAELARDIMDRDRSLADILDQSRMRTTMDLMEGLFPGGEQLLEEAHQHHQNHHNQHHQRRKQTGAHPSTEEDRNEDDVLMVSSSTYYSTSAPKAELLIKMKDMQEEEEEEDSEDELDMDLANKKQELMDSLSRKLQVLREARESLQEDVLDNKALGDEVEATVQRLCKPNELDKFRMFVGDLDKVVSLLLSLSGRLARVENALNSPEEDTTPQERRTLTEKRKLLIRQHEDAKELKDNLDRRERAVNDIVASVLDADGIADYQHFVKMKSALIIEQRKLEDKIKLGDEQLKCLMDSLPLEQRLGL